MPKKQSTRKRTQVKDLPKKEKKLSAGDMKKVKGGVITHETGHGATSIWPADRENLVIQKVKSG